MIQQFMSLYGSPAVTVDLYLANSVQLEIREVQISSVVLEHLKMQTTSQPPLISKSCAISQALTLFRPLQPPPPKSLLGAMPGDGKGLESTELFSPEGDAMDVE
ncbi:hypothetical protein BS17DRAFT_770564 [Gyrodon lividus]|nr:hypothetical protein BS17DRAFT_770564 [Gyrodon lividus]